LAANGIRKSRKGMIQEQATPPNGATAMERVKLNVQQRKRQPLSVRRRQGVIDSLRPLSMHDATIDLDVQHVHLFPERDGIVICFVTALGSTKRGFDRAPRQATGRRIELAGAAAESRRMNANSPAFKAGLL
jgi:hypothetical protein